MPRLVGDHVVATPGTIQYTTPLSDWHTKMTIKYRQAASCPWLPVPPDPPEPE